MLRGISGQADAMEQETPLPDNAAEALVAELDPGYPAYERYMAMRHIRGANFPEARERLLTYSQAERSALLCAIADGGLMAKLVWPPASPRDVVPWRVGCLLGTFLDRRLTFDATAAVFNAIARLAGETPVWDQLLHYSEPWQERMAAICNQGHVPTAAEKALLLQFKAKLEAQARPGRLRDELKRIAAMVRWIDKVCDAAPTDDDLIAAMTTRTMEDKRFPEVTEHFAFWMKFIGRTTRHVEALIAELTAPAEPDWLTDAEAYARRYPVFEGLTPAFGSWASKPEHGSVGIKKPFVGIHLALLEGKRPTTMQDIEGCMDTPATLGTLNLVWCSGAVPELARLADIHNPAQRALLVHLARAPAATKPAAGWLKKLAKLVDAVGPDAARRRMMDWLEQFAGLAPTEAVIARFYNYRCFVGAANWLQEMQPDLPACTNEAVLEHAAASLALNAGSYHRDQQFLFCNPNSGWVGRVWDRKPCHDAWPLSWWHVEWRPSLSNEALLRGVAWALSEFSAPGVVDLLERTVASAVAYTDGHGKRSRGTANAAIGAIGRIGTREALEALGRIRRSVNDKAIANTVAKSIAELAEKLKVTPADVEEMGLPDYGFG